MEAALEALAGRTEGECGGSGLGAIFPPNFRSQSHHSLPGAHVLWKPEIWSTSSLGGVKLLPLSGISQPSPALSSDSAKYVSSIHAYMLSYSVMPTLCNPMAQAAEGDPGNPIRSQGHGNQGQA